MRGATAWLGVSADDLSISTHAPRAGSDRRATPSLPGRTYFNPRSPCGERQLANATAALNRIFQPTLPVRGATRRRTGRFWLLTHFNPRSPCGERPEAAEGAATDLCEDFVDFVCGGVGENAAEYCANRSAECVDAYGGCDMGGGFCKGFFPKAAREWTKRSIQEE